LTYRPSFLNLSMHTLLAGKRSVHQLVHIWFTPLQALYTGVSDQFAMHNTARVPVKKKTKLRSIMHGAQSRFVTVSVTKQTSN
jgi:hypothetical protein